MSRVERKQQAAEEQKQAIKDRKKAKKAQEKADKKAKKSNASDETSNTGFKNKIKAKWNGFKEWFKAQPRWKKIVMVAVTTIVTLLLILAISAYAFFNSVFGDMFEKTPDDYDLSLKSVDGYINILLLGVDSRDMENLDGTRSDAIMMVSINEKTNDVKILSVYRDTYLKMGDTDRYEKITHACMYGGPENTMKSLNQVMDVDMSNYVVVNFKAVADLVDAVGGIEVDVKDYEIQQLNKYTIRTAKNIGRENYQLVEQPGVQTLEGVQAVSYSRIRKGVGDDFKRTERMRTVLTLTMDKMKSMSFIELGKVIKMMTPQVQTNISRSNILALSARLPKFNILGTTGWPYTVSGGNIGGASVVIPKDLTGDVVRMHSEFFGQENYEVSDTVIAISNAIAQRVANVHQTVVKPEEIEDELDEDNEILNPDNQETTKPEDPSTPSEDEDTTVPPSEGENNSGNGETTPPETGDGEDTESGESGDSTETPGVGEVEPAA